MIYEVKTLMAFCQRDLAQNISLNDLEDQRRFYRINPDDSLPLLIIDHELILI